jgi:hypothetical protein
MPITAAERSVHTSVTVASIALELQRLRWTQWIVSPPRIRSDRVLGEAVLVIDRRRCREKESLSALGQKGREARLTTVFQHKSLALPVRAYDISRPTDGRSHILLPIP